MSHLLQISIGPVQGFIAASRKTRDLAVGSALLTHLAQHAAECLEKSGVRLIFPASAKDPAANILLGTTESDPGSVAAKAKASVLAELKRLIQEAKSTAAGLVEAEDAVLDAQAEGLLEWFAAWTPVAGDYPAARRRVGALMAARKAMRDFPCAPPEGEGRPKSPLDPSFAGVLKLTSGQRVDRKAARYGHVGRQVKDREHLDAVGLVKRFGSFAGVGKSYPSTRKVAIAHLLEGTDAERILEAALKGDENPTDIGDALFGDLTDLPAELHAEVRKMARLVRGDRPLRAYYAVIHGDGDGMGELLDVVARTQGEEGHREFSRELSKFASSVKAIVKDHKGELVYAGGDDVVALAPMSTAIGLADNLRRSFEETVTAWAKKNVPMLDPLPSLTIGVGAVHVLSNLQESVEFARSLEKIGKTTIFPGGRRKNALTVGARPRGGADIHASGRWDDGFADQLIRHMALMEGKSSGLPRGYPYEIRSLGEEIERLQSDPESRLSEDALAGLIQAEVRRIYLRKRVDDVEEEPPVCRTVDDLRQYANLLLVSHFLTREGAE